MAGGSKRRRSNLMGWFGLFIFLSGLYLLLYPFLWGAVVDRDIRNNAQLFLNREEAVPAEQTSIVGSTIETTEPEETRPYPELWADMTAYNTNIFTHGQTGLTCAYDYQVPSFRLSDYGLTSEVFGAISIPRINLEMPIFLGATDGNMAAGAAVLSQTSLPIGGENTNSVIAGHRGYNGASYFRYIPDLQIGDEVIITNLWERLTYRVAETKIIAPDEVNEILIQEGKDLVTLVTCHPYASGGKQRYLVICERVHGDTEGMLMSK